MSIQELTRRKFVGTAAAFSTAGFTVAPRAFAQGDSEATPAPLPGGPIPELQEYANDWPVPYQNNLGHRRAPKTSIDSSNVMELGPQWTMEFTTTSGFGPITGSPIVIGDTIFFEDMQSNFYAVDRKTGEQKWSTTYDIGSGGPNGLAVGYGMVFGSLGQTCEMVALTQDTGEEVWRVRLTNFPEEAIRMAPAVHDGVVYVSVVPQSTRGNWGARGILHALNAQTGETIWYFDLSADNLWGNARQNMGAGLWYPPTFDEDNNVYFGNGNAAPWPGTEEYPSASSRPGENLYANTMMSIDPTTASVRWHVLAKPFDLFDLDFQCAPVLADVNINGEQKRVAIGSGKSGDVICVNAETGNVMWWIEVGKHQNDDLQELPMDDVVEVFPGSLGGIEVPPAYADGVFYTLVTNSPTYHSATGTGQGPLTMEDAWGEVIAIDAANGEILWDTEMPTMPLGAIVVANDLLFCSGIDGVLRAFNRETGDEVWNYQLSAGVNAPLVLAGDELIVPAGYPITGTDAQFPNGKPEPVNQMYSFQIGPGGGTEPTPMATPKSQATPSGEAQADPNATRAAVGPHGELEVVLAATDDGFDRKEIYVPAGAEITLAVHNKGSVARSFDVVGTSGASATVHPGERRTLTLRLPAGEHTFRSALSGQRETASIGRIIAE